MDGVPGCAGCRTLQRVRKQLEAAEEKEKERRVELRDLRNELAARDRQLEVSRRLLSRLQAEKGALETAAEESKAAARKLEHRLTGALDTEGLQAKANKYKAKASELKEQLVDVEARLILAEEANLSQAREIAVLKGALGLKSDLTDGALGSQARLLHAVAQSQEESGALALALAEKERDLVDARTQLKEAQGEVQRLLGVRMELVERCEALQREADEALHTAGECRRESEACRDALRRAQQETEEARSQASRTEMVLRQTEAALSAQQERGRQMSEKLAALERASRLSVEALRAEVSLAVEQAEARGAEARAQSAVREVAMQEAAAGLQHEVERVRAEAVNAAAEHRAAVEGLKAQIEGLTLDLNEAREAERSAQDEILRLQQELEVMGEARQALKAELLAAEESVRVARESAGEARAALEAEHMAATQASAQVLMLEDRLSKALQEGGAREEALQAQVSALRTELSTSSLVASKLQDELHTVRAQAAAASHKTAAAESHVADLTATVQQLTGSKARLQSGLLEQVATFRDRLVQMESENRELRAALGTVSKQAQAQTSLMATLTGGTGLQPRGPVPATPAPPRSTAGALAAATGLGLPSYATPRPTSGTTAAGGLHSHTQLRTPAMVGDAAARIGLIGGDGISNGGGGVTSAAAAAVAAAVSARERDKALYARALAASSALGLSATRGKGTGAGGGTGRGATGHSGDDESTSSSEDEDGEMTLRLRSRAVAAAVQQKVSGAGVGIGSRGGAIAGLTAGPTPTVSRSALRTLAAGLATGGK